MKHYIATNGEIIEPVQYGVEIRDPDSGDLLRSPEDWIPIDERFSPEFVATLREYDPEAEPNPPELAPPAEPEPAPVTSVTMRQARLALHAAGMLEDVQDLIATAGVAADIEWEFATTVERDSPLVQMMAKSLDLDLDALFADAATR